MKLNWAIVLFYILIISEFANANAIEFTPPKSTIADFPSEDISLTTLNQSFEVTDAMIPGPPGMDLVLNRRWAEPQQEQFSPSLNQDLFTNESGAVFWGKWRIDVPILSVTAMLPHGTSYLGEDFGCMGYANSYSFYFGGGRQLRSAGVGSASAVPSGVIAFFESGEVLKCEGGNPVVIDTEGRKFTFGELRFAANQGTKNYRLTSIADRFGNIITYTWSNFTYAGVLRRHLTSISRSDGATISINRRTQNDANNGRVESLTYHGRTVNYGYTYVAGTSYYDPDIWYLSAVTDPAGQTTSYTQVKAFTASGLPFISKIVLPSGGQVDYLPGIQAFTPAWVSVASKTISGPNLITRQFEYERKLAGLGVGQSGYSDRTTTTVNEINFEGSDDLESEYHFRYILPSTVTYNNGLISLSGQLVELNTRLGGSTKYRLLNTWSAQNSGAYACKGNYGANTLYRNCSKAILTNSKTQIYESGGIDEFETAYTSHDTYGYPLVVRRYDVNGGSLWSKTSYTHEPTLWLLGRVLRKFTSDDGSSWTETDRSLYYPASSTSKGLLKRSYRYGIWQYLNSYHTSGELNLRTYNGAPQTEMYSNYHRGVARSVRVRKRYSSGYDYLTRTVDHFGNITSENDYNGNVVNFEYDAVNRMTKRDYADSAWLDTTWAYYTGSRYSRETTGTYERVVWWDGLQRTWRNRERDTSLSGTTRYVLFDYDRLGRTTFVSDPSPSSTVTVGTTSTYDLFARRTSEYISANQTSRSWTYLAGHRVEQTDGRGKVMTTTFRAFGSPTYEYPSQVLQSEGVTTAISYNKFDNVTQVTQGGVAEAFLYHSNQRLCKRVRPDVGNIGYQYNNIGQVVWRAHGSTGSNTSCGGEASADKITWSYDNRGDLTKRTASNGFVFEERTLDPNSNLTRMASDSGVWDYEYNSRNLLEKETASVGGQTFVLDWSYDTLGHRSQLTYPSGLSIGFNPNALGQPRRAGSYATGATYHRSGKIASFTYGNGIVRQYSLNSLGMISEIADFMGSSRRFEHDYVYDREFNVVDIHDRVNSLHSVNGITYDDLGRIRTGNGSWGSSDIRYDTASNITYKRIGGTTLSYSYLSNRLSTVTGGLSRQYGYDSRGAVTSDGTQTLTVNVGGQITGASGGKSFGYDGHGRRIRKQAAGDTTYYAYGIDGTLYYQETMGGEATSYIYLGTELVAKEVTGP